AVIGELARFVENRGVMGLVLFVTMLFFSSLAFTVLENAMSVIFVHRVVIRRRHFLISAILPYCYIVALGIGLLRSEERRGGQEWRSRCDVSSDVCSSDLCR